MQANSSTIGYMAVDQYGQTYHIGANAPRKWLLNRLGRAHDGLPPIARMPAGTKYAAMAGEKTYPIAANGSCNDGAAPNGTRFRMTGEYRAPLANEWFISGAIPEAYRTMQKLAHPERIAVPV